MSIFLLLNLVRLELQCKIGVWINSGGINSLGRPKFELGSLSRKVRRLNRAFVLYCSWKINRQIIRIIESKSTHSSWIFRKLVQFSETGIWFALTSGYSGRLCYAHFSRENQIFEMSFNLFSDFKEPIVSSPLKYDSLKRKSRHFLLACICGFGTNRRAEKSAICEWSRDTPDTTRFLNVDLSEVVRWEVVDCWPIPSRRACGPKVDWQIVGYFTNVQLSSDDGISPENHAAKFKCE